MRRMLFRQFGRILLLLLLAFVPVVYLQIEDNNAVQQCVADSERLSRNECQYVRKQPRSEVEPEPSQAQIKQLQKKSYAKEKRQRLFECMSQPTNGVSTLALAANLEYQDLVSKCKLCQRKISCNSTYKFRTYDGTCNNKDNWHWGSTFNCLTRFLPANYEGVSGFRKSVCGKTPLPNPRYVSLHMSPDISRPTQDVSNMMVFFGQFLAHDTTDVPTSSVRGKEIDCCSNLQGPQHPQCAPILLPKDDPFYSKHNITCFSFVRSAPCDSCYTGKRNQMTQVTSYIDLSATYGISEEMSKKLRCNGTKLKTQSSASGDLMPPDYKTSCGAGSNEFCFLAGDRRVNQHTSLMGIQTLFVREHNRLADALRKINPDCPDDDIFEHARDLNIAQMQVITYKEFLPALLGPDLMTRYDLWIQEHGCTIYDPTVDATILAEFNTAGYRLHSMISRIIYGEGDGNRFKYSYGEAGPLYHDKMDSLMKGVCQAQAQMYDIFLVEDVTEFLYRKRKGSWGFDIVSFNIQRGRDHGLPTYTQMVNYFSKGTINMKSFDDLKIFIDDGNIQILRDMYCDVQDIDLWVGLVNERVPDNMAVGPTAAEIIAREFSAWKFGDRFYFEHCENKSFNETHRETLRVATLSSLLCLNTNIESIQENAMLLPSAKNPVKSCRDIPKVDLSRFDVGDSPAGTPR